jgi:cellulose synthase/poly-beta-1,6-N-acetylglucosamine synthase-like glycosyltransferase
VRQTRSEIVAFSDANCTWAPDALRRLVEPFADPDVAYVCGQLRILDAAGGNKEGLYWRYEMSVRSAESALGSVTGGNGSIYALRRADYVEVDPRFGHDLALPYVMVQRGRRAVYEPAAHAFEVPTPTNETEYRRKVRMFEHCWLIVVRGRMLRRLGPVYGLEIVSHRHLRYASGILHLVLLATSGSSSACSPRRRPASASPGTTSS